MLAGLLLTCAPPFTSAPALHDPINAKVTWTSDIARLVEARCVRCHSPGGRAPMPLTTYEDARPWARAMREEVLTRRMPKWHAARGYGSFANDPSLSPFEIALVVAWADAGAPRGTTPPPSSPSSPTTDNPPSPAPTRARTIEGACGVIALPPGTLRGIRPILEPGASAGITLVRPTGERTVLAWIRNFDPAFVETYWLRTPVPVTGGTRILVDGAAGCRVIVEM